MPIGTCSLRGMGMKRSTLGSMSHETEDRFGALAEALYSTTLGHVAFVQGSIFDSVGVFRCMLKRILLPKMWQKVCGPSSLENEPTIFGATEFCSYFVALSYSRALLSDGRRVRPSVRLSVTRWYWLKLITVGSRGFHRRAAKKNKLFFRFLRLSICSFRFVKFPFKLADISTNYARKQK